MTMLSIVTPTYNRANLLRRCYESLKKQSDYRFEWIVIDDGSTDGTNELFREIIDGTNSFPIFYKEKKNGGKHTALNESHELIHGDYVLILDSDDQLNEEAVQIILKNWEKYADDLRVEMLIFLKQNSDGRICAYVKNDNTVVDYFKTKRITVVTTDCCEVIRSSTFKKYPFPVFENEKYVPESVLWSKAALNGYCVYVNEPVYVCEYIEGGLTRSGRKLRINNPRGGMYNSYLRMSHRCTIKERIKGSILYTAYSFFAKKDILQMFIDVKPYYLQAAIGFFPGVMTYMYWRKKYGCK